MLLVVSAGLTLLGLVSAVRWAANPRDALGRTRVVPVLTAVVPVAAGLALAVPVVERHRTERRLSAVASVLAGHAVEVDCASTGAGLVHVGSDVGRVAVGPDGNPSTTTVLADGICDDLERWRRALGRPDADGPERPDVAGAVAVHVLTHESMHLAGILDEAAAECAAVQRDSRTARLLGASGTQALRLVRTYWLVSHPDLPEAYRSPECVAGQRLDEHLPDAPWAVVDAPTTP